MYLTADGTNSWTIWNDSVMNSRSVQVENGIRGMNFMIAVDTNVLLYAVDEDEPAKRKQAREFLRQLGRTDEPLLMWQVLGEFLAGLRRWEQQRGYDLRRTRRYFELITSRMRIEYPSLAAAERSFEFRERYRLSHWDSMLLAACAIAGVDTLYSEDMDDGMTYDTVKVVSPFAGA